jgi:hypothetical protein
MSGCLSSLKIPRLVMSLSLVLWVGGAGCLMGCQNLATAVMGKGGGAAQQGTAAVVSGESCAAVGDHSCCAKPRAAAMHQRPAPQAWSASGPKAAKLAELSDIPPAAVLPEPDGPEHNCPLVASATALATRVRADESSTQTALWPAALPLSDASLTVIQSSTPTYCNNRGHTYLRCCVFLI